MIGIMLLAKHPKERSILEMAFKQLNIKLILSEPNYANYVKLLQYKPDIIVLEIPRNNTDQLHFVELVKKNKATKNIPIIAYGNKVEKGILNAIIQSGVNNYLERPLKFTKIMQLISKYLKLKNKSIENVAEKRQSEKEEDIEAILNPTTLPTKKIELMIKHISSLMAFPFTVAKVINLAESNKSGANDLAKVIEADPVISTSILKVSNTVFFASSSRRINNIKDAIVRIGFNETKRIVMTMSVMDSLSKETNNLGFDRMEFWHHSLATAIISEKIAKKVKKINPEEAFLAGLLHDFGIILLDEFYPTIFEKILEETTNKGARFITTEQKMLKITHIDVIKELFTMWKLPDITTNAITQYSTALLNDHTMQNNTDPVTIIAICVAIANQLAKSFIFGASCDMFVREISNKTLELIKYPNGFGKAFKDEITNELTLYKKFLQIDDTKQKQVTEKKNICIFNPESYRYIPLEYYLAATGHNTTIIPVKDDYSEFDKKFDMIFIWSPNYKNTEEIVKIKNLLKKDTSENNTETPPSLVFIKPDENIIKQSSAEPNRMFTCLDLRKVEECIIKLDENKQIELPPLNDMLLQQTSSGTAQQINENVNGDNTDNTEEKIETNESVKES